MLMNNEPMIMSFKEERSNHLNCVYHEIDAIPLRKDEAVILESGFGNCINVARNYLKSGLDKACVATPRTNQLCYLIVKKRVRADSHVNSEAEFRRLAGVSHGLPWALLPAWNA
jgi:hypothetical protein